MDHALGLAGRAAGERDQARIGGVEVRRRRRLAREQRLVGDRDHLAAGACARRARRGCARRRRSASAARRRAARADPWRGAARCTRAPRRRSESRPPSSAPTPGGCRPASGRRPRAARPGAVQGPGEACAAVGDLAEATTRGAFHRGPARPAPAAWRARRRLRHGRSSTIAHRRERTLVHFQQASWEAEEATGMLALMGLMSGNGPLGRTPAGTFNFEPPPPGRALYFDPCLKRVRVVVGGETIADSRNLLLLQESGHQPVYYFPSRRRADGPARALRPPHPLPEEGRGVVLHDPRRRQGASRPARGTTPSRWPEPSRSRT